MNFSFKRAEDSPGFLLWQLTNEWQRKQRKALAKVGLTHAQFVVLANVLWLTTHSEAPITQQDIAEHAHIDKMMLSDLVMTLCKKKLLHRTKHKDDKRAYALTLTDKGHKLALKAIPIVEGIDAKFFNAETKNLKYFLQILNKILN